MVDVGRTLLEVRAAAEEPASGEAAVESVEKDGRVSQRRDRPGALLPNDGRPILGLVLRYYWAVPMLRHDEDKWRQRATRDLSQHPLQTP